MTDEAYDTSAIEGELLNRESVQSSIRRHLGLKADRKAGPAEAGIAELMVDVYRNIAAPFDQQRLFAWRAMAMNGRRDLDTIGGYRKHNDSMQIVSGPLHRQRVHFEAPPSARIPEEMRRFLFGLRRPLLTARSRCRRSRAQVLVTYGSKASTPSRTAMAVSDVRSRKRCSPRG